MFDSTVGELYDRCTGYFKERTAIRFAGKSYTHAQLRETAYRVASGLRELEVKKGDRLAFLMANCPETLVCEYAVAKLGVVRVPLAVLLAPSDHIYILNHSECTTLIYHQKYSSRVAAMIPHLSTVNTYICFGGRPEEVIPGHHRLEDIIANHHAEIPPASVGFDDLNAIYYTGGTTGRPKGVLLPNRSFVWTYVMEMVELGLGYDEVFVLCTPLTHASGALTIPILARRGVLVVMDHFDPKEFMEVVEKERATGAFLVPTMIYMLLDHPDITKYDLGSLRNVVYGASTIAPQRLRQAIGTFGPIFTQLYGQTEVPMIISALPREEHMVDDPEKEQRIFSSCGRPTLPSRVRIVNENGSDLPFGTVGEIVCRHPNMMDGYLKNPELTAETIKDWWLHTGDVGMQDEEGFLYIVDRSKDMIVSGGFNIFPREIEDVLHEHPAVKNVAVVGVPDPKWGEAVKAIVSLHPNVSPSEDELIQFVKTRKGSLVVPKSVEFWDDIPLTNLGKLDKKAIRERFWKNHARRV